VSGSKISIVLAATALAVSVLFATPLGQAASRFVLPKNSVGAAQLRKNAVGTKKLVKNAVNSAKVKDGSLLAADFKSGQLPAGPKGDPGQRGPKGDKGDPGKDGVSATKLWAVVDSVGNIAASSGVTTLGSVMVQKGVYLIPFNRDISHCARVATIGGDKVLTGETDGSIRTFLPGATSVQVETATPDVSAYAYHAFSLAVFC
jgi:hypothetical protein